MSSQEGPLERALQSGEEVRVGRLVDQLTGRAWLAEARTEDIEQAMLVLREYRRFSLMVLLGDAAITRDPRRQVVRQYYCQALIESGALAAAEAELQASLDRELRPDQRSEVLGLLGRIYKQRFVRGRNPTHLDEAQSYYAAGWEDSQDPAWHGVNMLALRSLRHRLDRPGMEGPTDQVITTKLLETVAGQHGDWSAAVEAEVRLAQDDLDGAVEAVSRFSRSDPKMFHAHALRRQLVEVWGLDATDEILLTLDDRIAGPGQLLLPGPGDQVQGVASPADRFEKIFGAARALQYRNLADGLAVAQSVGKVTDGSGRGIGTAFLVPGSAIHESLGADLILVTNAHVISDEFNGALPATEAEVQFDVTRDVSARQLVCRKLEEIWSSPMHECDVTLLRFQSDDPDLACRIEAANGLPVAIEGTYVTVVGHPAGGELSLSLRGNDLIEYDPPRSRMHYRAPTEPGSSGSPVFDSEWKLVGVHHAGHQSMPRLAGPGFHSANEATTLRYIRSEFARQLIRDP